MDSPVSGCKSRSVGNHTSIHTIGRFLSTKIRVSSDSNRVCTVEIAV